MRTTLTIDDEIAVRLERENRRAGEPWKQTVNRVLLSGLDQTTRPAKPKRFIVKPLDLGTTPEQWAAWKSMSVEEILESMDESGTR